MKNPWEEIQLSDYEKHMQLDTVMQQQCLNTMMKKQFYQYIVKTIMIFGIAGGNGLEHIDSNRIKKVYGVDINRSYLKECSMRYEHLGETLECLCVDVMDENAVLPHADLIVADLFVEYVGYKCFKEAINKVKPKYVSAAIQINTDDSFVSRSPYLHVFDRLNCVHHQIDEDGLTETMRGIQYQFVSKEAYPLPNGKKLLQLNYKR